MTQETKIQTEIDAIGKALANLKRIYNEKETSMQDMYKIMEFARLLEVTDFTASICD